MKLSIIIPVYNVENYIKRTLDSLLDQAQKDFEVIIVDDGSTDNTFHAVTGILKDNIISNKIIQQKNCGVSKARNNGLKNASGEYVLFLDGDDYLSGDAFASFYELINFQNDVDCVCWAYSKVTEDGITTWNYSDYYQLHEDKYQVMSGMDALKKIIVDNTMQVMTGSILFKKQILLDNGIEYQAGCSTGEDQEFWYKALSRVNKLVFISEVNAFYLQRRGSITNSYDLSRFDSIYSLRRTCEYLSSLNNDELKTIIDSINEKLIIQNYFFNLESCYVYSNIKAQRLLNEINKIYPNLNNEMSCLMKKSKYLYLKLYIKIKVFSISPSLFLWLVKVLHLRKRT